MIVSHLLLILHKKIQFYIFMFEAWNVAKGRKVQGGRILSQGTVLSLVFSPWPFSLYLVFQQRTALGQFDLCVGLKGDKLLSCVPMNWLRLSSSNDSKSPYLVWSLHSGRMLQHASSVGMGNCHGPYFSSERMVVTTQERNTLRDYTGGGEHIL